MMDPVNFGIFLMASAFRDMAVACSEELSSVVFAVEQPKRPVATMETSDNF